MCENELKSKADATGEFYIFFSLWHVAVCMNCSQGKTVSMYKLLVK